MRVNAGIADANAAGMPLAIFEGYRSPERQNWLYEQGRSRDGKVITRAKAWESAHQAGVAVDLAIHRGGIWSWDFTAADIHRYFASHDLEFLDFESAHMQITSGLGGRAVAAMARDHGISHVWAQITERLKEKKNG